MFSENDIKKGMKFAIWEGSFATIHSTVTSGAFLTGFALMLGTNDFEIALLTAIPLVTQILQIFSIHAVEYFGRRKWISGICSGSGRILWAFLAVISLVPSLKTHAIPLFLISFTVISSLMSFAGAPWLSWMADLVPANIRGRYFGKRNMILGIVTMVISILAGHVLDYYKSQNALEIGFFIIEMVAVLSAIISFGLLIQQPEPPFQRTESYRFFDYVKEPFRSEKFKKLLRFYLFFIFAIGLASSYFPVYLLKTLNWSFSNLALLSIGSSIMTLLTQPLWGRLVDRVGHKPVIKTTVIGLVPLPVVYFIATPGASWPVWLDIIFTGVFNAGFTLVMFTMVFYSLPDKGRPMALAVYSALTGVINFIAMILGGLIAQSLAPVQFTVLGKIIINYHFLFVLTLVTRIAAIPLINKLEEPEAKTIGVMLRKIVMTINRQFGLDLPFGFLNGNGKKPAGHFLNKPGFSKKSGL